ncbi:MAG: hypothetical protein D6776_00760 [Planctomycetota bacterium]|nr:MAG: hypothetical protein D6776_00760 [Planctomycetota bacterium]
MQGMIEIELQAIERPDALADRFVHARVQPFGTPAWSYAVALPASVQPERDLPPPDPGSDRPGRIGSFPFGPPGVRFDVGLYRPGCEVGLVDYLGYLRERLGFEIDSADPVLYGGREGIDAVLRAGRGPQERIVRLCLFRHRSWIARLGAMAPPGVWDAVADDLAVCLSTFRFLAPGDEPFLEPFRYSRSAAVLSIGCLHPERWRVREREGLGWGRAGLELRWIERNDLRAVLLLEALERSAAPEITRLEEAARLGEQAMFAYGLTEPRLLGHHPGRLPAGPREPGACSFRIAGRAFGDLAELRLSAIESPDRWRIVATLGPAAAVDPLAAMAAWRAHEIAVLSLDEPEAASRLAAPTAAPAAESEREEAAEPAEGEAADAPVAVGVEALGLDPEAARAEREALVRSLVPDLDPSLLARLTELGDDLTSWLEQIEAEPEP